MTWRLESASLPRLSGLPSKAEPLSMLLLPGGGGSGGGGSKEGFGGTSVLILYEGGALASYNLTSALVPSAEYAAGGTTSTSTITHRSSLSIALMTVAIVALVIGISMLFVGLRLGLTGTDSLASLRPWSVLRSFLRLMVELMLTPAVALLMLIFPRLLEAADQRAAERQAERQARRDARPAQPAPPVVVPPVPPPPQLYSPTDGGRQVAQATTTVPVQPPPSAAEPAVQQPPSTLPGAMPPAADDFGVHNGNTEESPTDRLVREQAAAERIANSWRRERALATGAGGASPPNTPPASTARRAIDFVPASTPSAANNTAAVMPASPAAAPFSTPPRNGIAADFLPASPLASELLGTPGLIGPLTPPSAPAEEEPIRPPARSNNDEAAVADSSSDDGRGEMRLIG